MASEASEDMCSPRHGCEGVIKNYVRTHLLWENGISAGCAVCLTNISALCSEIQIIQMMLVAHIVQYWRQFRGWRLRWQRQL